jgi:hypothetical protein
MERGLGQAPPYRPYDGLIIHGILQRLVQRSDLGKMRRAAAASFRTDC